MKRKKIKLGNMYEVRTGGVMSRLKKSNLGEGKKYKLITLKSIDSRGQLLASDFEDLNLETEVRKGYLTRKGDIVVRLREPISAAYVEEDGLLISNLFGIVRGEEKEIDKKYIAHFLNTDIAKWQLHSEMAGTFIKMLRAKSIEELEINLPDYEEQKKITSLMDLKQKEIGLLEELVAKKELLLKEDGKKLFK